MNSFLPEKIREELIRYSFVSTGYSSPNPPVACVLEDANTGEILASASTQKTGQNHAEREAYRLFREKFPNGKKPSHNAYVTLEPCSHYGKTPPCIDLFLEEKPVRLEYGWKDPNPLVSTHSGLNKLAEIGIQVFENPELAEIASGFLFGFKSRIERKRPALLLKTSLSKEGYFSSGEGLREKISSLESDIFLSMIRAKVDAILVGPNTVKVDEPGLDFRIPSALPQLAPKILYGPENSGIHQNVNTNLNAAADQSFSRNSYKGFSGLVAAVLEHSTDPDIFQIHKDKEKDYQPLRVFFLPEQNSVSENFLEKQDRINDRIGKKNAAFFMDEKKTYDASFVGKLETLSKFSLEKVDYSDVSRIFEVLYFWEINTALVEGGNFLYRLFSPALIDDDAILEIQSNTVSFPKGILPEWTGKFSMEWKTELGSDLWGVGRCSQD
ncbi:MULTISPECIES: bifunctional diaminohydroxyphosphoribosylaminopyrimidine deaminase/5-amino-6-(5-phosphoribosylamino)uracil reductase [unclassified Leptospira]|uniref:bifunctional diaminohydroxyphosphoribosylaminopyrimidine deaminase/5-amino-6-(5-phosphoribosylamino)uracil reductase RibD n=1 Tax=unclassified Leptospira TaxID=2633828 RepID=UPI0002BD8DF2|nr:MULTISPECIES: bifunctional diaminohydroxyphosphoribosylaminopyrimidine deaminase/5-amino-6-(5-phosphoribosylamino)uracil reductase [unclassified Leptospira]EMJ98421.1 cytidine and deoxycytidylate deaminase zinc-binding region [Leptospira sp. B5-022]MCR1795095.1 bifunctional diaminohydroxyphosphoribosylaminopyrimidine deaminase/5-amino-6-(5-phosphoribosylamino)uracil reductase [Leptospira sp. id769339]